VTPYSTSRFELADESRVDLDVGRTWVKVGGKQEFTQVVFGKTRVARSSERSPLKRWRPQSIR
jgi:hypothetical protein